MEITVKGKQCVASKEFALALQEYTLALQRQGTPDDLGKGYLVATVAWVLAGRDINSPPTSAEDRAELKSFVDKHVKESMLLSMRALRVYATRSRTLQWAVTFAAKFSKNC